MVAFYIHLFADESITIAAYSDPSLVGSIITIDCRFGSISSKNHNTTNNIMCLENGEWDPDPNQIKCKGIKIIVRDRVQGLYTF